MSAPATSLFTISPRGIAIRFAFYVALAGFLVTMATSLFHSMTNYDRYLSEIQSDFSHIQKTSQSGLAKSLWIVNQEQTGLLLDGMLHLHAIRRVEVLDPTSARIMAEAGTMPPSGGQAQRFALSYEHAGKSVDLGVLIAWAEVTSKSEFIRTDLIPAFATSGLEVLLLGMAVIVCFYYLVVKHLGTIARYARDLDFTKGSILTLQRPRAAGSRGDELDLVAEAINQMRVNLTRSFEETKQAYSTLEEEVIRRREAEGKYREIVEGTDDIVTVVDGSGRFLFVNHTAQRILGLPPADCLGRLAFDFVHPDDQARTAEWFQQCQATRIQRGSFENRQVNQQTGHAATVFWSSAFHYNEKGEIKTVTGIGRDITNRLAMEEELRKARNLEALGTIAGGIAHDFNNLLTGIYGNIELARMSLPPQSVAGQFLDKTEASFLRTRELTGHLLTFAKGGSPRKEPAVLAQILRAAANATLSESAVAFELDLPADILPFKCDRGQIEQVFRHLFTNALEAMPGGGEVRTAAVNLVIDETSTLPMPPGRYIHITVADTGRGIDPEILPRIFDPYFSTKGLGTNKGTGLSLAICHSIVTKHDGCIEVSSNLGMGTTFHVYLPAIGEKPQPVVVTGNGHVGLRLLVMDDEEIILNVAGKMLAHLGYAPAFAHNGEEAVALYGEALHQGSPFAAVLLDLTIRGGLGGVDTIRRLAAMDPQVRAIVASGYADDPAMLDYTRYGFTAAVAKPFTLATLKEVLDLVMGENREGEKKA